jgi:hypothetical protein
LVMNEIKPTDGLPDLTWSEHAKKEIEMTGIELVSSSDFVFRIGKIASVGFIYSSFTSPPWMWFVLAEGITIGDLVDLRRLCNRIPKGTLTCVANDFPVAHKFAKLYGFEYTGEELMNAGNPYKVMEKK